LFHKITPLPKIIRSRYPVFSAATTKNGISHALEVDNDRLSDFKFVTLFFASCRSFNVKKEIFLLTESKYLFPG